MISKTSENRSTKDKRGPIEKVLVLGSKPLPGPMTPQFDSAFVANGAFSQLGLVRHPPRLIFGVFTPYLFLPNLDRGPYKGREELRRSAELAIKNQPPAHAFLRPVGSIPESEMREALSSALCLSPEKIEYLEPNVVRDLLFGLLAFSRPRAWAERALGRVARMVGRSPRPGKISTGVLALALSLEFYRGMDAEFVLAGVGISSDPYPENDAFRADRSPHLAADVSFLLALRKSKVGASISVVDPELDQATRNWISPR